MEYRVVNEDPIEPTSIVHGCEDIWAGKRLEQRYNYLVYTFERNDMRLTARAYLDDPSEVSFLGLGDGFVEDAATEAERTFVADAARYMSRRYAKLKQLGRTGYSRARWPD